MLSSFIVYACLGYVVILFCAHLYDCWQHPPSKTAAAPVAVKEFDLMEIIDPAGVLADPKPIALLPPASEPEFVAVKVDLLAAPIEVEPMIAADDLLGLTIRELKQIAKHRRISNYSRPNKLDLLDALS